MSLQNILKVCMVSIMTGNKRCEKGKQIASYLDKSAINNPVKAGLHNRNQTATALW